MGCDIHFAVDVFKDNQWISADNWKIEGDDKYISNYDNAFYEGRNYDLFAILANVRNGSGFAGIKTGEGFNPISEPKGVPDDCSKEFKDWVEQWQGDGHSHSYFTVKELMEYDWTQTTQKQGWVGKKQYAKFKVNGSPDAWSGMISGGGIKHISNEEMEKLCLNDKGEYDTWKYYHLNEDEFSSKEVTLVKWEIPYYHSGKSFLSKTLPRLWRLGKPDEVRCLFFFDN